MDDYTLIKLAGKLKTLKAVSSGIRGIGEINKINEAKKIIINGLVKSLRDAGYGKRNPTQLYKEVSTYVNEGLNLHKELKKAKTATQQKQILKRYAQGTLGKIEKKIQNYFQRASKQGPIHFGATTLKSKKPSGQTFKKTTNKKLELAKPVKSTRSVGSARSTRSKRSTRSGSILNKIRSFIRNKPLTSAGVGLGTGAATGFLVNRGRQSEF
ncbi:MAG: hypothetical protein N2Z85_01820 [Patescibacteria group bacterium]|nr:hypothetical protein [Patescibacteria group bacterium]